MTNEDRPVRPSVLDRLIDTELKTAADGTVTRAESVRRMKESLLRDVEWLLNTRRTIESAPESCPELQRSLYHFGLPDTTSLSADSDVDRRRLLRSVEESLRLFEPRLAAVRVTPGAAEKGGPRQIRFVIEALLRLDPEPERVVFDTVLEGASGKFVIRDEDNA
jgi:type VI secretion system protein ImpF